MKRRTALCLCVGVALVVCDFTASAASALLAPLYPFFSTESERAVSQEKVEIMGEWIDENEVAHVGCEFEATGAWGLVPNEKLKASTPSTSTAMVCASNRFNGQPVKPTISALFTKSVGVPTGKVTVTLKKVEYEVAQPIGVTCPYAVSKFVASFQQSGLTSPSEDNGIPGEIRGQAKLVSPSTNTTCPKTRPVVLLWVLASYPAARGYSIGAEELG